MVQKSVFPRCNSFAQIIDAKEYLEIHTCSKCDFSFNRQICMLLVTIRLTIDLLYLQNEVKEIQKLKKKHLKSLKSYWGPF